MSELGDLIEEQRRRLAGFARSVNIDEKRETVTRLEGAMSEQTFWNDQEAARRVIDELKAAKGVVDPYDEIEASLAACGELIELAEAEDDAGALAELAAEADRVREGIDRLEIQLVLSGPYDSNDVFMTIKPGAGGTDACDWAQMMVRMYTNYCERAGYNCDIIELEPAAEAGIKSATLHIKGSMAYGHLKSEMGTHRLVRMSPFNAGGTRETSFAAVEVTPELPDTGELGIDDLDEREFRIDTYRASGAGGQHVNKTDSAVRLTHLETGIATSCQSERSQQQNKHQAWKMMAAKLQQLRDAERLEELKDLGADRGTIGWGHQIRSYVLQPTQLITDLRTRHKEGNAQKVLDGDIQEFIDSYLNWRLKNMAG
ncbi:MAG: peptide chain release factor 2 [Planctomycetota bacterium]